MWVYNCDMPESPPIDPKDHLLGPGKPHGAGPLVGIIVIVIVLLVGALYFWGQHLNRQNPENDLPFILPDNSTSTASPTSSK